MTPEGRAQLDDFAHSADGLVVGWAAQEARRAAALADRGDDEAAYVAIQRLGRRWAEWVEARGRRDDDFVAMAGRTMLRELRATFEEMRSARMPGAQGAKGPRGQGASVAPCDDAPDSNKPGDVPGFDAAGDGGPTSSRPTHPGPSAS